MGKAMFSVCPHLGGGGGVRSSWGGSDPAGGGSGPGGGGQVQPAGGESVQPGGGGSVSGGGRVSISCPLAGGMPLAFTQEDFLVPMCS